MRAEEQALRAETGSRGIEMLLTLPFEDIVATGWHGLVASRRAER